MASAQIRWRDPGALAREHPDLPPHPPPGQDDDERDCHWINNQGPPRPRREMRRARLGQGPCERALLFGATSVRAALARYRALASSSARCFCTLNETLTQDRS